MMMINIIIVIFMLKGLALHLQHQKIHHSKDNYYCDSNHILYVALMVKIGRIQHYLSVNYIFSDNF